MSSWVGDWWERGVISPKNGDAGRYRTECKLGRHAIFQSTPARWVTDSSLAPMGLSCVACLQAKAAELGRVLDLTEARVPKAKAPAARKITHGRPGTYSGGCRCTPCREAASAAQAVYRANRRARRQAAS